MSKRSAAALIGFRLGREQGNLVDREWLDAALQ